MGKELADAFPEAAAVFAEVDEALGEKLQGEGVVLFERSYDELLAVVEERRRAALRG